MIKIFRQGMFYGDFALRRRVGAIDLAELRPTVPEHEVETHSHDDAHFVLLLAGKYVSSAQGMPPVCTLPTLIYNPPRLLPRTRRAVLHAVDSGIRAGQTRVADARDPLRCAVRTPCIRAA
jgi:hypothetical protein